MQELDTKAINQAFFDRVNSGEPGMVKDAQDTATEFTRRRMREDGFARKIIPPVTVTNEDLNRQVDTDKPTIVVDMEPNSPAAISVPFATLPMNRYIRGPRYRVMFDRVMTPRFTKDVDELRTWHMDIRQVLSDNAIKDMLAEEDGKFIRVANQCMGGAQGATVAETGTIQWQQITGGITRTTINDALKIMPSTPAHLETATALINNVTVKDLQKWGRDMVGGDLAEEIVRTGFGERTWLNVRFIVTIKRSLVPDSTMFMFSDPKYLGKFFLLEDTVLAIEKKFFFIEFFAYETIGGAIANVAGVARADFVPAAP